MGLSRDEDDMNRGLGWTLLREKHEKSRKDIKKTRLLLVKGPALQDTEVEEMISNGR